MEKKIFFSFLLTILDAILDFSARHQLCQFMPAVSETTGGGGGRGRINPSPDVVNINAFAKFGQIPSICSQDIGLKRNSDINQGP